MDHKQFLAIFPHDKPSHKVRISSSHVPEIGSLPLPTSCSGSAKKQRDVRLMHWSESFFNSQTQKCCLWFSFLCRSVTTLSKMRGRRGSEIQKGLHFVAFHSCLYKVPVYLWCSRESWASDGVLKPLTYLVNLYHCFSVVADKMPLHDTPRISLF